MSPAGRAPAGRAAASRAALPVLLLLAGGASARAQDCAKADTQAAMTLCADRGFKAADASLNTLYRLLAQRVAGQAELARLLVVAQRAWVGFRDAECGFVSAGSAGGSIQPMVASGCAEALTRKRIADLKAYLTCQEGDASCPVPPPP